MSSRHYASLLHACPGRPTKRTSNLASMISMYPGQVTEAEVGFRNSEGVVGRNRLEMGPSRECLSKENLSFVTSLVVI